MAFLLDVKAVSYQDRADCAERKTRLCSSCHRWEITSRVCDAGEKTRYVTRPRFSRPCQLRDLGDATTRATSAVLVIVFGRVIL